VRYCLRCGSGGDTKATRKSLLRNLLAKIEF
jgi:hypothetical protein